MDSSTDPAGNVTKYTYDKFNHLLTTVKQLKDEKGVVKSDVTTSQTYTWDGQIASQTDANGNKTVYIYDSLGHQIKVIDALGHITYKAYDRLGRNTSSVSPKNYKADAVLSEMDRTVFIYDALGRVLEQRELYHRLIPDGTGTLDSVWSEVTVKKYEYDSMGNVISTIDDLGDISRSTYNLAGMIETMTDAETAARDYAFTVKYAYNGLGQKVKETYQGASYSYQYDGIGDLLRTELDGVMKSSSVFDLAGREISITDALGNTTTKKWNNLDKVSKITTQGDATIGSLQTIYQYDKLGNLLYTKDSIGAITTYTYDSLGRNLSQSIRNDAGDTKVTTYTSYDLNGNILMKTDGNGNSTSYTYDVLNRNITVKNALNQVTTYAYDNNGNLTSQKDYLGNITKNVYDGINRLVETRDAYDHIVKQLEYNDVDAQVASYDAQGNKTVYLYDKNLRQAGTTDAEGNTSTMVYDLRGNIIEKKDGNGNITSYQYDADNHLTKVTDALGNNTTYTYDAAGNLLTQTDGNGNTTTYRYNSANLLTSKIDPLGSAEIYTYYANWKMKDKIDRNGIHTSYTYDVFGRLLKEDAGGQVQSYTYDANGNMLTMTDDTGTTTRTYDALNRNTSKNVPVIGKSVYEYDLAASDGEYSERTTDPKGNITLKTYDKIGRLSKVTADGRTTQYTYYNNGNRKSVKYPDGTTETYSYDKNNRVAELVNTKGNGTEISSYRYTYDAAGNQLTKTESKGITSYTYDSDNRLSTVTEPEGRKISYTYDAAGNRRSEQVAVGILTSAAIYTYDSCNRLSTTVSSEGTETRYIYDKNGNLVSKSIGVMETINADELSQEMLPEFDLIINKGDAIGTGTDQLVIYSYDNYNRLTKLKSGSSTTTYGYNAQGYRVEKKTNSKTTRYLYEYDKVVLEIDGSNNQMAFQVYGTNLLYRSTAGEVGSGEQSYYYLYNAHGDVTSLLDMSGNIAVSYDYDAFGNIKKQIGTADNPIRYAGYQYDEETGLYYLNARYYDSVTARFLSEDSPGYSDINDPLSLNLYTYCSNNPILYIDPTGHMNYLTQSDNLIKGVAKGVKDSVQGIIESPKAIIELGKAIVSGKISAKDLAKAGLSGLVDDYVYVVKNSSVINPTKKATDKQVEAYGKRLGAIVTDIGIALAGAGAAKVAKVLSGTSAGAKIVSALDKVDNVAKGASKTVAKVVGKSDDVTKVINNTTDIARGTGKTISNALPENGRFATVMPKQYAEQMVKGEGKLSGGTEAWITSADDLSGVHTVKDAAKRLTLVDDSGNLRLQGDAVVEFEFEDISGIATPYNRSNPGFVNGGKTRGGAREWVTSSDTKITNIKVRHLKK